MRLSRHGEHHRGFGRWEFRLSRANLAEIAEHGHDHVVAARLRALPKHLRDRVCDRKSHSRADSQGHRAWTSSMAGAG